MSTYGRPPDLLDPQEIAAELDGPAVVSSGHTLRHGLLLRNLADRELQIATNGQVTAVIVDPRTGEVVGGFSGTQRLPLIIFRVAPGEMDLPTAADDPWRPWRIGRKHELIAAARAKQPGGDPMNCRLASPP